MVGFRLSVKFEVTCFTSTVTTAKVDMHVSPPDVPFTGGGLGPLRLFLVFERRSSP